MDINIKNGIKVTNSDNYTIYQMYTDDAQEYYMCTPNKIYDSYKMVIDFPEEYYKSLLPNDIINEITKTCNSLYKNNEGYIYVLTNVTNYELNEAKTDNDNHAYSILLRKIQKYTYNAYHAISNQVPIDTVIGIIIQTDDDLKFINWLEINLNGLFTGIRLNNSLQAINTQDNDNSGWTTLSGPSNGNVSLTNTKSNGKVKKLVPPKSMHGFSSVFFMITVLMISLTISLILSILILKIKFY